MRAALLAAALALAACEGEPQQEAATPVATATPSAAAADKAEPPANATPEAAVIPVEFLGVWDAETGSCDPASDLWLDIREDTITFCESVSTVESVRDDAGTAMVTLAIEGEGEKWTQRLGLRFFDGGTSLMIIDPERPGDAEQNFRKRCPA